MSENQAPAPGSTALPPGAAARPVTLQVNGNPYTLPLEPRTTLLDALREVMHLTGTKKGCDRGQCGACTVLSDGRRLLNRKTAHNQLMGGIVWGIGMALHEKSELDPATGRVANANLAEYHMPVNADIGTIDVSVVDEDDPHINALGTKCSMEAAAARAQRLAAPGRHGQYQPGAGGQARAKRPTVCSISRSTTNSERVRAAPCQRPGHR
ncbi:MULTISPECIES: (2Fe-2S)-binding protein [Cupriavidus]|uniref:(2Fe-2S)-binding protein n=1 Tax=Cupriavidus sp. DF5525 TaxID=3160989 RepID=UPI0003B0D0A9|nr:hypothetical protein N234_26430 [Ralstonia pickettii DTP0602]